MKLAAALPQSISRYGLAFLFVAISIGIKMVFEHFNWPFPITASCMVAITITVWYCGLGPAIFAFSLSCLPVFSLLGMKERVLLTGGMLGVNSIPGHGSEVRVWFPLAVPENRSPKEHQ